MENNNQLIGLTNEEVLASREKYGENLLSPPKRDSLWKLFLEKFKDPIIRILLIAAFLSLIVSFVHKEYAETIGIFCAIFLSVGVAFWFETDANRKFDILNQVNDDTLVKVIRNGNISEVPKKEIVVGDIILLETGEEIPADAKLINAISLLVNESCLTGELSISKTTNPQSFHEDSTYPSNMIYRGTTVIDGHCSAEVTSIGDATEFGKVAREATETSTEETPLNKQLDKLAKFIGIIGFALATLTFSTLFFKDIFFEGPTYTAGQLGLLLGIILAFLITTSKVWLPIIYDGINLSGSKFIAPKYITEGSWLKWISIGILTFALVCLLGFFRGTNPFNAESWIPMKDAERILEYFMIAVTLIVVAVPEGLPMSVTLSLALSMRRMLKTNNLVRKMHACETMGAATVICTDKTGTLTQNQMRINQTNFYGLKQQQLENDEISKLIIEGVAINSTAFLDYSDSKKIKALGNPTEAALLLWLNDNKINYLDIRKFTKVVELLTFSTERKFMATAVDSSAMPGKRILYVKGAPEIILGKCKNLLSADGLHPIEKFKPEIDSQLLQYQNQAMRTLGFAYKEIDINDTSDIKFQAEKGLTFLGIVAISDPVREDVPEAVNKCIEAGIKVKIVTGDTPGTAKEIGRQIGIWKPEDSEINIITGPDFEALPEEEAFNRVRELKIMCRARPTDKQRLVQLLQKNNEVVAVTGDGTNDAPALNYAQVGLSMGSGTSVAKEASDITLLDDSFNSIATAVMWGRSLYKNIQRFILFQLTINVAAMIIVFLGSILGHQLPLTVTQMLWVNLIMDTFAAAALASLPPDSGVMKAKPRKNDDFIITQIMRFNILFTGLSFVILLLILMFNFRGEDGEISRYNLSCFFTIFVMLQFWNMFNAKAYATGRSAFFGITQSFGFIIAALIILVGQFLIVQFGGDVFRTAPITPKDWLIIIGSTSGVLWIGEIIRFINKQWKN